MLLCLRRVVLRLTASARELEPRGAFEKLTEFFIVPILLFLSENRGLALGLERTRDEIQQRFAVERRTERLDAIVVALGLLIHCEHRERADLLRGDRAEQHLFEQVHAN